MRPETRGADIRSQTAFGFVGECLPRLGGGACCASGQASSACSPDGDCVGRFGQTAACIACPDRRPATNGRLCAGNAVD